MSNTNERPSSPTGESEPRNANQGERLLGAAFCSALLAAKTWKERVLGVWNFFWRGKTELVIDDSSVPLINHLCSWGGSFEGIQTQRFYSGASFRDESRVTVQRTRSIFSLLAKNISRLVFK